MNNPGSIPAGRKEKSQEARWWTEIYAASILMPISTRQMKPASQGRLNPAGKAVSLAIFVPFSVLNRTCES
jgi:hypothetical protein